MASKEYRFTKGNKVLYETQTLSIDVFMLIFFLLLAFRGLKCGSDTKQYLRLFNEYRTQNIVQLFSSYEHEFGYKLVNRLIGAVTTNYQVLLVFTAAICVYPLWYFYKRESENQLLSIALFLTVAPYMMYFSGIRQAIAMSLGIPAWYAAKNKKLGRFIAMVILATQFHTSALMLFLLYPMYHLKITKKWLWFVGPCMIIVFVFRSFVFNFLFRLMWQEYELTEGTGATNILILLVLFGMYSYIIPDEALMDNDTIAMRNFMLLSIVIQIFAMLHPLSMRMNYYFLIFVPILIPKIAKRSKKEYAEVAQLSEVVMIAYFMYYFINNVITDDDALNIFPYISFLQNP
jgi:hypothetical protein